MIDELPTRIRVKIEQAADSDCWLWTASLRDGYGQIRMGSSVRGAHVVVYELLIGEVPDGCELDHTCRVRRCVNPGHLDAVVHVENVLRGDGRAAHEARQTHCKRGHPFIGVRTDGRRACGICRPVVT